MSIAGVKFDPSVNMGAVIQAATIIATVTIFGTAMNSSVEYLRKDAERLREDFRQQQSDFRALERAHVEVASDIRYIKQSVSNIQSAIDAYRGIPNNTNH